MNAFVNVQVRILAAQAQNQLNQMQAQLNGLSRHFGNASKSASLFGNALSGMRLDAFGSRIQWIGRQLEYNFTLPIIAASTASYKFALENEAAFKRVEKVYGDATHNADFYRQELNALKRTFEQLSDAYGVNQKETIDVAASWAAAGSSGLALAKAVDLTMKTMILGEMKAAEATEALISIQAQYGLSIDQLVDDIAILNMVENQTGISLTGLVQGFSRAAGVARAAGVDVRNLAAMLAALTPATGSAAQAGNALKTIFSRLLSPTEETVQVLHLMGIEYDSLRWKSATITDQLSILANTFETLSDKQKGVVSSVVASRWQVNKFEVLMKELNSELGYYQRALDATSDKTAVATQMTRELTTVLKSNPRRLQVIWTMLKNSAADIITPMIPLLLYLAGAVKELVTRFSELDPAVQKLVIVFALLLAAVGPLVRMGGALVLLAAQLGAIFRFMLSPISLVAGALWSLTKIPVAFFFSTLSTVVRASVTSLGPLVTGVMVRIQAAVLVGARAAGIAFRLGFGQILPTVAAFIYGTLGTLFMQTMFKLEGIVLAGARGLGIAWRAGLVVILAIQKAWSALMAMGWRGVMIAILTTVGRGLSAIVGLFTKFIPIMRAVGLAIYAALTNPWGLAIVLAVGLVIAFWDQLKKIWSAVVSGTIQAFNALPAGIRNAMLAVVNTVIAAAEAVYNAFSWMNPWAHHSPSLVENVTTGVTEIKKQYGSVRGITGIFADAGIALEQFAKAVEKVKRAADQAEIAGQRADLAKVARDALPAFDKLVKMLGPLRSLLAKIQSQIDAQQAIVDEWGAKLDKATAEFTDRIFENEMAQKKLRLEMMKMEDAVGPLDELKDRLDAVNGAIEMLNGEQAALRNAGAGSDILKQYDDQIATLEDQKKTIEDQIKPIQDIADQLAKLAREGEMLDLERYLKVEPIQKRYDAELAKLDQLKDSYSQVEGRIRDIEQALHDMSQAAQSAAQAQASIGGGSGKLSPGAQNFIASAGGNFPDVGGKGGIGREGGIADQAKLIDDFTKEMAEKTKNMFGMFNFLDPIKRAWNSAWGWVKQNIGPAVSDIGASIAGSFSSMGNPFGDMSGWLDTIKNVGGSIKDAFGFIWDMIGPDIIKTGKEAWAGLKDAFKDIEPEIKKFKDLVGPMGKALKNLWTGIKPVLAIVLGLILLVVKALLGAISGAIGPIIRAIGDLIAGIIKIIRGIIEFIVGVFTGDWKRAWQGIVDIFSGLWQAIWGVIKNLGNAIWGAVKGFVMGIIDFFVMLYDKLVGHSIIPDMMNAILDWFKKLRNWAKDIFDKIVNGIIKAWNWLWAQVMSKVSWAKSALDAIVNGIREGLTRVWNGLRDGLKSAWDWLWDKIKSKIDWAKGVISGAIDAIKGIVDKLGSAWKSVVETVKTWIDKLVGWFKGMKDRFSFSGLFDGLKTAFKSAVNWIIDKWNNLSFGVGPFKAETPNIPRLARGGMIARQAMAIIGEGRRGWPEYVIPTDPMHRARALALFNRLGRDLLGSGTKLNGLRGGTVVIAPNNSQNVYHFHGDLSFPNVKSSADAEEFLRNLEALVSEM